MSTKNKIKQDKIKLTDIMKHIQKDSQFLFEQKDDVYFTVMCDSKTEDHFVLSVARRKIKKSDDYKYIVSVGIGDTVSNDIWGQQILLVEFSNNNKDISEKELECAQNFYEHVSGEEEITEKEE